MRVGGGVDEQRARQRVGGIVDALPARLDSVDVEHVQLVRVLGVVGVAEEAHRVGAAEDALHQDVVILAHLQVAGAQDRHLVLVEHLFHEVFEGAAVGAGNEALNRLVRPVRVDVAPIGGGAEQGVELFHADVVGEGVVLAHDHGQGIGADADLDRLAADSLTVGHFLVLDRPAGVGNVGFAAGAEPLEAGAAADAVDADVAGVALVLEPLDHALGQREHGGTAGGNDVALYVERVDAGQHRVVGLLAHNERPGAFAGLAGRLGHRQAAGCQERRHQQQAGAMREREMCHENHSFRNKVWCLESR